VNLGPPSGAASSARPFQHGRVLGDKNGFPVARGVEWLVDTGAEISTVRNSVGSAFDIQSVGLSASPTTGGGGIQVVTGMTAEFEVEHADGLARLVQAVKYMGIKSNDAGSDLLGAVHLAEVGASVQWDPAAGQGSLRV
jgi:hypothetical protein